MPDVDTLTAQANTLMGQEKFEEALISLQQLTDQLPGDPRPHTKMGVCYQNLDRDEEAVDAFINALNRLGWPVNTLYFMAKSLFVIGDNKQCIKACKEFIEDCQDDAFDQNDYQSRVPGLYYLMGMAHMSLQEYADAEQAFKFALQGDPDNTSPLKPLGDALMMNEKVAEAIPILERAVQAEPDNAGAYFALGFAYHSEGNFEAAWKQVQTLKTS